MDRASTSSENQLDAGYAEESELNLWNVLTPLDSAKYSNFNDFIEKKYKGKIKVLQQEPKRPMVIVFHHFTKGYEDLKCYTYMLNEVAKKYEDERVTFVAADYKDDKLLKLEPHVHENRSFSYSRLYRLSLPSLYGVDAKEHIFRFFGYLTAENIKTFADKLLTGLFYASEPIPTTSNNTNKLIKVAVADNFDEMVWQSQKDVFLILYSPHCRYSEELLENASKLADALEDEEHIEIIQMNSKANYIDINLKRGYNPICHFMPRLNKRSYITYDRRSRDLQDLINFVAKNATDELKHFDRDGNIKTVET